VGQRSGENWLGPRPKRVEKTGSPMLAYHPIKKEIYPKMPGHEKGGNLKGCHGGKTYHSESRQSVPDGVWRTCPNG